MRIGASYAFAVWLSLAATAHAQAISADPKVHPAAQSSSASGPGVSPPSAPPVVTAAPPAEPTAGVSLTPSQEWAAIAARLEGIDAKVSKLGNKKESPDYTNLLVAFIGVASSLLGVFVGGFITFRSQKKLAEQQWQLKQLSELYGPLRALLRQSHAVYRYMNAVLEKLDPAKFRLVDNSSAIDYDKKTFEVKLGEQWGMFRTIVHIDEVYGRAYGVEAYFDEVVAIGGRIVAVIEQKAGMARPDQPDLPEVFGRYLAHYSVLRILHAQKKAMYLGTASTAATSQPASQISVMEVAAFPIELQGLVDKGFDAVNKDLKA